MKTRSRWSPPPPEASAWPAAKKLAEHGAKVYLAVRNLEAGKKAAGEIIAAGGQADVVYFDAGKEETFGSMVDEVVAKEGRIDILVNNYGSTDVKVDLTCSTATPTASLRLSKTILRAFISRASTRSNR